jgi:hypothetical protein
MVLDQGLIIENGTHTETDGKARAVLRPDGDAGTIEGFPHYYGGCARYATARASMTKVSTSRAI